jgi:hypothetical protein
VEIVGRPPASGAPEWIERSVDPSAGADPLGLQTITTDRIIPLVAPGVLALSDRARYLSFYAFVLDEARRRGIPDQRALSHFVKQREYELALAVTLCPKQCGAGPNGALRARPAVNQHKDEFPRSESIDSHLGGYGLYYRSPMRSLGLVAPAGTPYRDEVLPVDVLFDERADRLAAAFRAAIADTDYARRHLVGTEPIPRSVIEEYATVGCLCGLVDDHAEERDAIRSALFDPGGAQPAEEVRLRREAFALVLRFLPQDASVAQDPGLRAAVWNAFEAIDNATPPALAATLARWVAVAGRDYAQEAIANLWTDAGTALQQADAGWGITAGEVQLVLRGLVPMGDLVLPGGRLAVSPGMETAAFVQALKPLASVTALPDLYRWAAKDRRAIAGLALLFALRARLPDPSAVPRDWRVVGGISGDRQPGLLALAADLDRRVRPGSTVGDTMAWAVRELVLLPHEWTANSKLPEFTFRFRWEGGRLTFFTFLAQPFGRFGLNNIRAGSLTSLATDLGLVGRDGDSFALTSDGSSLVDEVFGA